MNTNDLTNYGTVLSYAVENEDNELTFTDYGGFVLSVKGQKVVTDITANDGTWTFICSAWKSTNGQWAIFVNGHLTDRGAIINYVEFYKLSKNILKLYKY